MEYVGVPSKVHPCPTSAVEGEPGSCFHGGRVGELQGARRGHRGRKGVLGPVHGLGSDPWRLPREISPSLERTRREGDRQRGQEETR